MDAKRDWGHAKDYVEMQWLMLQQDEPDDFVISTGKQHSVREFVQQAARELGMHIFWQGSGLEEIGVVQSVDQDQFQKMCAATNGPGTQRPGVQPGQTVVKVDPRYFRPTEVESLLGDPSKAREKLGWQPKISFAELVQEMVAYDLEQAQRDELCKQAGFQVMDYHE